MSLELGDFEERFARECVGKMSSQISEDSGLDFPAFCMLDHCRPIDANINEQLIVELYSK